MLITQWRVATGMRSRGSVGPGVGVLGAAPLRGGRAGGGERRGGGVEGTGRQGQAVGGEGWGPGGVGGGFRRKRMGGACFRYGVPFDN